MKKQHYYGATLLAAISTCGIGQATTIQVIVPLEHEAMTEIVSGFKDTLHHDVHTPLTVEVKNAQHDNSIEQSIIRQATEENTAIIAPIGVNTFEMTRSLAKKTAILGIATDFSNHQRLTEQPYNATSVDDEVNPRKQLAFIHQALPGIKQITLIHSADDKIFPEVKAVKQAGKKDGITVQNMMVGSASDIYTAGQRISPQSQAIFVLKDSLVVSAIPALTQEAEKRHIALITSDDGSVQGGGAFALGVSERQIGVTAGKMAAKAINEGGNLQYRLSQMPVETVKPYRLFINLEHAKKQGVPVNAIEQSAKKDGYGCVCYTAKGKTPC